LIYALAVGLVLLNLVFWAAILFNLPGTWLMVLTAAVVEWQLPGEALFGWPLLVATAGLALLGEILEFVLGAAGARQAGGSRRGAALAIVGSIIGAIAGTPLIPIPVVGTIIGACAGAFAGAVLGDLWAGQPLFRSVTAGQGAAVGRFWGTVAKFAIGALIVAMLAVASFV
jgi:uncharacterized protein YqgC (DUF456 family)